MLEVLVVRSSGELPSTFSTGGLQTAQPKRKRQINTVGAEHSNAFKRKTMHTLVTQLVREVAMDEVCVKLGDWFGCCGSGNKESQLHGADLRHNEKVRRFESGTVKSHNVGMVQTTQGRNLIYIIFNTHKKFMR